MLGILGFIKGKLIAQNPNKYTEYNCEQGIIPPTNEPKDIIQISEDSKSLILKAGKYTSIKPTMDMVNEGSRVVTIELQEDTTFFGPQATIPEGVTSIGAASFDNCTSAEEDITCTIQGIESTDNGISVINENNRVYWNHGTEPFTGNYTIDVNIDIPQDSSAYSNRFNVQLRFDTTITSGTQWLTSYTVHVVNSENTEIEQVYEETYDESYKMPEYGTHIFLQTSETPTGLIPATSVCGIRKLNVGEKIRVKLNFTCENATFSNTTNSSYVSYSSYLNILYSLEPIKIGIIPARDDEGNYIYSMCTNFFMGMVQIGENWNLGYIVLGDTGQFVEYIPRD